MHQGHPMRHNNAHFHFAPALSIAVACFFMVTSYAVQAQRGQDLLTQIKERMPLTDAQEDSIQKLTAEYRDELRKYRETFQDDREAMRIVVRERTDTYYKDVGALMNENQKSEYEKLIAEIKERTRERLQRRSQDGRGLPRP